MLGGAAFIVDVLLDLAWPLEAWTDAAFLVAILMSVVGLAGFHTLQKSTCGLIGGVGFWTVVVASAGQMVNLIGLHLADHPGLGWMAYLGWLDYPVGELAMLVGFVLYGAATLQGRVLSRWCGVLLIVVYPVTVALGATYGYLWSALVWVALGYVLWSQRNTLVGHRSRVS
jgi:hypothetical protein